MTNQYYAICFNCKNRVYAGRHGKIDIDSAQELSVFLAEHVYSCDGEISVCDESFLPDFLFEDIKEK